MEKSEHEQLWFDMPEFVQPSKEAIKQVTINFEDMDDLAKFNELTGLNITMKTKGVFYPKPETQPLEYR